MTLFELDTLAPGTKGTYTQPVMAQPDGSMLSMTVLAIIGEQAGPTLVVLAGVHGDEYEGIRTVQLLFEKIKPSELRGRLIMVPVCNVPAFFASQRNSPIDGLNLARVFPGDPKGTVTQRIAHILTEKFIARADFLIDLHSSAGANVMPTMIGYYYGDSPEAKASQAAALVFGTDVVWGHPYDPTATGRSISAAIDLGIPWLYTESLGARSPRPEDIEAYTNGVLNVMRHMGMLEGTVEAKTPKYHLVGSGNTDMSVSVNNSGYFLPTVELLERVSKGQLVGRVLNLAGETIEELYAHVDGRVGLLHTRPTVHAGEGVILLSGELSDIEAA